MPVSRLTDHPLIHSAMDSRLGGNINGPSLVRVPDWIGHRLGRYYLYFAHHQGKFIRLAYADALQGPWTIYRPGTLALEDSYCTGHIASPDVHVDHDRRQIRMYYHGPLDPADRPPDDQLEASDVMFKTQRTRVALSTDGLHFQARPDVLAGAYLRAWRWRGGWYGLAMPGFVYRSPDGLTPFELGPRVLGPAIAPGLSPFDHLPCPRHLAVRLRPGAAESGRPDRLEIYFTRMGDAPEHILRATMELTDDWTTWRAGEPESVLKPELPLEGADCPHVPSQRGAIHERAWQLRDPAIYEEDGQTYLLYTVAGEAGIAMARVEEG